MLNIPVFKPYFDDDELQEIKKVLDSGWVAQGPEVKKFEEDVTKYLGVKYAIAVTNGTSALHLALRGLNIDNDDSVLVADFTFPATGHAVLYCGASPIFVDVEYNTYNIDPTLLERNINSTTKAIIPVHTFGQCCKMDEILEVANKYNLKVIEDAACAFGAKYKNKFAGTIGDVGCFSFHARKGITTGEGGMVITNNKEVADKVRHLSVFGMATAWDRHKNESSSSDFMIPEFTDVGYNYKMSDITAAVGIAQLRKIDLIIKRKQDRAKYYDELLKDVELITIPYVDNFVSHVYQSYIAIVDKSINRNMLITNLLKKGIQTRNGTYACHIQPVYDSYNKCPVSLDIFNRSLTLPLYVDLEWSDMRKIAQELKQSLKECQQ